MMKAEVINIPQNLTFALEELFKGKGEKIIFDKNASKELVYHEGIDQLTYVSFGEGYAYLNEVKIPVKTGDLIVIPKGTHHGFLAQNMCTYHIHWPLENLDNDRVVVKVDVTR